MTIGKEGLCGKSPAALVEDTARRMGAPFQTPAELRAAAEVQVAEVQARVAASNQSGLLKQLNAQYKRYRQAQMAKAEKAVPYSAYLQRYTAIIVAQVAATGRAMV